jgi:transposase
LISPQFVVPFRKGHKTDRNDALAIVEAGLRPEMRFVPIKVLEQQDIQSLHRVREQKVKQRTQLINQVHGLLLEYGIRSGRGQKVLRETVRSALEDGNNGLSHSMRELLAEQLDELMVLNERIRILDRRVARWADQHPACRLLQDLPSVGPVGATQLYAALGRGEVFGNGRQAAAYLGVTPRQFSSGGKAVMIGIGFTGHAALRSTLVRGAQSVIKALGNKSDRQSDWLRDLVQRAGKHKAAVALANKTVRMAWAILRTGQRYCPLEQRVSAA